MQVKEKKDVNATLDLTQYITLYYFDLKKLTGKYSNRKIPLTAK